MTTTTDLIPAEQFNIAQVFGSGKIDDLLDAIREKATDFDPTTETTKGRKEIASMAYKVSQSKTVLDKNGKALVAGWKEKAKAVDAERKKVRDTLDALRDEVRQPLTAWEEAEEARKEADRLAAEIDTAWGEAISENEAFDRLKEIERREAKLAAEEERKRQEAEAKRIEQERIEREAQLKKEAEERAKREAEAAIAAANAEAERWEREAAEAIKAEQRRAELAIKEAEENARREAEREQREKEAAEAAAKAEAERKAQHWAHKKKVNNEALAGFIAAGFDETVGKSIVELIATGQIEHVSINY